MRIRKTEILKSLIRITVICILLMFSSSALKSQVPFQRTAGLSGHESVYSVLPVSDGYLLTGLINSAGAGEMDILLVKTYPDFSTEWSKTFGGDQNDYPHSIISTSDGGYLIVGRTESFGEGEEDVLLIKLNAACDIEWEKTYGNDKIERGYCALETGSGDFVIGGQTQSGKGGLVFEVDPDGNLNWSKTYGFHESSFRCYNIVRSDNGNYVFDGPYESPGESFNYMLMEIDPDGNLQWAKTYNASGDEHTSDVTLVTGDGFYILGRSTTFSNGSWDLHLIKTDLNGDFLWAKNYASVEDMWASQMMLTSDNELFLTCHTDLFDRLNNDIIILKCDLDGNLIWGKSYGGTGLDNQHFGNHRILMEVHDDLFTLVGKTSSFGQGLEDIYYIGFDKDGKSACNEYPYPITVTDHTLPTENVALPVEAFAQGINTPTLITGQVDLIDSLLCPAEQPPIALFSASNNNICIGGCIDFIDESLNDPNQWEWSFEGAVPSSSSDPSPPGICYPDTGCFDVQLIVHNDGGSDTNIFRDYICVYEVPVFSLGEDTTLCYGDSILLEAPEGYASYLWNTGSTEHMIRVGESGEYQVAIEDEFGCSGGDAIVVNVNAPVTFDIGPDSTLCEGDSIRLSAPPGYFSYTWQDGSDGPEFLVQEEGIYRVGISDDLGCTGSDSAYIAFASLPKPDLGPDTAFCDANYLLQAGEGYAFYEWQDGSSDPEFLVEVTGEYWVEVTSNAGCRGADTVNIEITMMPDIWLGNDTTYCKEISLLLDAGSDFDQYLWQDGSSAHDYLVSGEGIYWVRVDFKGCEDADTLIVTEDCPSLIWFPNSFTPNGDGKNEVFKPVYDNISAYSLLVFDRWGTLLFESRDVENGWDGNFKGKPLPSGVYVFMATYSDEQSGISETIRGTLSLLR